MIKVEKTIIDATLKEVNQKIIDIYEERAEVRRTNMLRTPQANKDLSVKYRDKISNLFAKKREVLADMYNKELI